MEIFGILLTRLWRMDVIQLLKRNLEEQQLQQILNNVLENKFVRSHK